MPHYQEPSRWSRAQWLEKYETELLALRPHWKGRINWGNAHYYYGQGMTPANAAKKEVSGGN